MASQIHLDSRNKLFIWGANSLFIVVKLQMILDNENIKGGFSSEGTDGFFIS